MFKEIERNRKNMVQQTSWNERGEIKTIKESTPKSKIVNPKLENNRLADHFTTNADQTTLPKKTIIALNQILPLSQSILAAAKHKYQDTKKLFTFHEK